MIHEELKIYSVVIKWWKNVTIKNVKQRNLKLYDWQDRNQMIQELQSRYHIFDSSNIFPYT